MDTNTIATIVAPTANIVTNTVSNNITAIVALITALSVASERLVEIIKGLIPALNQENPDPASEERRQAMIQILAVGAGILTAWLASTTTAVKAIIPETPLAWIVIGLLASGGSGFWNSIQGYVNQAKDVKKAELQDKKVDIESKKAANVQAANNPIPPRVP